MPKYFILQNSSASTSDVSLEERRERTFEKSIKIKGYDHPITIISLDPLEPPHHCKWSIPPKNLSVLKSNLQKCVRRGLVSKAVKSAYSVWCISPMELLRRLPIIIVEDTLPFPGLITLTWYMMAVSKGYVLSDEQVSWILGVVYTITKNIKTVQKVYQTCVVEETPKNPTRRDVVWSMVFRRSFGGMKGDIEMLKRLEGYWSSASSSKKWHQVKDIEVDPIDLDSLGSYKKSMYITAAIDQHCFSFIPKKIRELHPEYSIEEITTIVWKCRSSINFRNPKTVKVPYLAVWTIIQEDLEKLSHWVIDKLVL